MQLNNELIEDVFFNEVLPRLKKGKINIPIFNKKPNSIPFTFRITLDAYDKKSPYYLNINDREKLVNLLCEYASIILTDDPNVNEQNIYDKIAYYLTLVWANATYEDLRNPEKFIQKYIDFNNNPLFDDFQYAKFVPSLNGADINVVIEKELSNMESPYSFNTQITLFDENKEKIYYLPSIRYGISNDVCYIYAVQNRSVSSNDLAFEKKIKRCLYKMNENVFDSESLDFKEYVNLVKNVENTDELFYPENITDVSVSAILSLMVFMDSLNKMGIKNVKVVPFLPIRYKNKEEEYKEKYKYELKELGVKSDEELKQKYDEKRLSIQKNLTDKFIRDFMRLKYHFDGIDILSYPLEFDEFLSIKINNMESNNNKFINDILENKVKNNYTL